MAMAASSTAQLSPPPWKGPAECTTRSAPAMTDARDARSEQSHAANAHDVDRSDGWRSTAAANDDSVLPARTRATPGSCLRSAAAAELPTRPVPPTNTTFLPSAATARERRWEEDRA